MRKILLLLLLPGLLLTQASGIAQTRFIEDPYTYRKGEPFGTGKWFMGREIAHVMGYQGMAWLERDEREAEERTSRLLRNMDIQPGDTIVDVGAGSGYHVFRMAPMASRGLVYAVDIQEEMLEAIRGKKKALGQGNVVEVMGTERSIELPEGIAHKALMVDVYHEFSHPLEMLASIRKALKPGGKLYLVEYRGEDPEVPIKRLHKMTEAQAVKELQAAGFRLERNLDNLPWQHCMVFVRE
ncbi:class I SAM-dependent methyltransferase [Robiginitalea sediminis]|uniref:class I SAM-dependent methyltransferase n=1 Tax=Robiginitalea sediminis TaxID=1982593 RepID=UPI002937411A|nr:class I SAM-dependent methyltransferase [Robiginitalea sediminis]